MTTDIKVGAWAAVAVLFYASAVYFTARIVKTPEPPLKVAVEQLGWKCEDVTPPRSGKTIYLITSPDGQLFIGSSSGGFTPLPPKPLATLQDPVTVRP
jgi:hypothetical protein